MLGNPQASLGAAQEVVLAVASTVVVWAEAISQLPRRVAAQRTIACSLEPHFEPLQEHLRQAGRGVVCDREGNICALQAETRQVLGRCDAVTGRTRADTLLGVATAWGLGQDLEQISSALASLPQGRGQAP